MYLFVVAPVIIGRAGLGGTWPILLGLLAALWAATVVCYVYTHRAICPERRDERRHHAIVIALTPLATIRAIDLLLRERLTSFHPLAIAAALCPPATFRQFAAEVLRDLVHPCTGPTGEASAAAGATAWFRSRLRACCEQLVRRHGLEPAELLHAPPPEDPRCQAYCPRCFGQFVRPVEVCPHCPGIAPLPFGHEALTAKGSS